MSELAWDIRLCYTHWADGWTCLKCGSVVLYETMELHTSSHHPNVWPPAIPPSYARTA